MANFKEARDLTDELHSENRISNSEYDTLRDCIDFAEDEEEFLISTIFELISGMENLLQDTRRKLKRIGIEMEDYEW